MASTGYYCVINSTTATPSGVGGDVCSPGHYCLEGSFSEEPCPPGTFLPSNAAQNVTYCLQCTSGDYCNASGLSATSGQCDQGAWFASTAFVDVYAVKSLLKLASKVLHKIHIEINVYSMQDF